VIPRTYKIAVLPGDGIGPEVVREGIKVLLKIGEKFSRRFEVKEAPIGGAALDKVGVPLPPETLSLCKNSDAVLLGAIGGPKWHSNPPELKPEQALLALRKELGLFANLRPAKTCPALIHSSTLKPETIKDVDLLVVRELTGGLYYGEPRGIHQANGQKIAVNTMIYSEREVERIAVVAFEAAKMRRKRVCSVDKANVLECSQLWRSVVNEVGERYQDVELTHMYVDNCAMQLIRNPSQFDVLVTENLFGDILSDEAAMLTGSIGMLASASLGGIIALYEPVHGSAPDIAGQGKANPIAAIASVAMMLRMSLHLVAEADAVEQAILSALMRGHRTADICAPGESPISTTAMGDIIVRQI
jgi:3-isopropylmalate dehydrogenase